MTTRKEMQGAKARQMNDEIRRRLSKARRQLWHVWRLVAKQQDQDQANEVIAAIDAVNDLESLTTDAGDGYFEATFKYCRRCGCTAETPCRGRDAEHGDRSVVCQPVSEDLCSGCAAWTGPPITRARAAEMGLENDPGDDAHPCIPFH